MRLARNSHRELTTEDTEVTEKRDLDVVRLVVNEQRARTTHAADDVLVFQYPELSDLRVLCGETSRLGNS